MEILVDAVNNINKSVSTHKLFAADRLGAVRFSVIVTGTITAGTPKLVFSHDDINFVPLTNEEGEEVVLESGKIYGVDLTSGYIKVDMTGVTSSDLQVTIA